MTFIAKAREAAARGLDVISFGVGQPDAPTFPHIVEAGIRALEEGFTGYTETQGIPELRKAIADYLNERYGAGVSADEVIVTTGAKTALFVAMAAVLRPGDEVLIPEPSYPSYASTARILGARPVFVPLRWTGRGFELDVSAVEERLTERTKMIVLNNPHNPTGTVFNAQAVEELVELASRRGIAVLADEIYDNFVYEGRFRSVLESARWRDVVLYVNGHSKTFSMTGWRLGWLVADRRLIPLLRFIAENVYSCAPSISQRAGVAALRGPWEPVREMVEEFRQRRDIMVEELSKIPGVETYKPQGAFYVFPRLARLVEQLGMTVEELVEHMIYSRGVVMIPGSVFPDKAGALHVRLSYALRPERIREGMRRFREEVENLLEEKAKR
ncbi:Aspartate aminotransferase [Hyperthermus butylicus DSM 5456]|uniref:Aspartate aminotransferase n=1 Tax=Hyperthermus butylicus (strain DSM 5456 / JCM 9403 / PLM1-5) TaxID=415426 RepID=A2BLM7_HYPBU|nr:Aspartate aminotransferase [Hyperthermus butylicus DSM 5456]